MRQRLQRGEERIAELKAELGDAVSSADRLARVLEEKERSLSAVTEERDELASTLKSELDSSRGREVSEATMSAKLQSLQSSLEESEREKEHLDRLQRELRSELSMVRKNTAELSKRVEDAERQASRASGEASSQGAALTRAREDLLEARAAGAKQDMALEEAQTAAAQAQRRADMLQNELSDMAAQMESKLGAAEASVMEHHRSGVEESVLREQLAEVRAGMNQWRSQAETLQDEQTKWVAEKRRLEADLSRLNMQASAASQGRDSADGEAARVAARLEHLEGELGVANAQIQRTQLALERKEAELQGYIVTMQAASRDETELKAAQMDQKNVIQALESEVRSLKNALLDQQSVYSEVRSHGDDAAAALLRKAERLATTERELTEAVDKIAVLNEEIVGLEMSLQDAERRAGGVSRRADVDRDELRRAVRDKEAAEARVSELMALVTAMEAASRSANEKASRLSVALQEEAEAQRGLMDANNKLKGALDDSRVKLHDACQARDALDRERDEVQAALDERVEALADKERLIAQKSLELTEAKAAFDKAEQRLRAAGAEVASLKGQCSVSNARLAAARQENAELVRQGTVQRSEVVAAADDLTLMTRENQALTSELAQTSHENGRLRDRVGDLVQNTTALEQAKRALEIERADLIESYRGIVRDKRKLETDLETIGSLKERAGLNSQQLQSQVAELKGQLGAVSGTEARWAAERISLGRRVESLNDQLIAGQRRIDALNADNQRLMQESLGLRKTNSHLNERVQMAFKRAASATDANKLLSARLGSLERENNAMRAVVSSERQRSTDLETVAQTARTQAALQERRLAAQEGAEGGAVTGEDAALEERLGL